jgi:hypothetical protein
MADPASEHGGLAGARAGEDQERPVTVQDGLALRLVEPVEKGVADARRGH